ncbi:MAG: hypothetical protein Ct9H300mP14_05820 [Gammaproteobacteria bacterium]|nr:MAG: hypothetical protein Ct9H300mP14_05820 [Gammaproteobacteria bacterium]
MLPRLADHAVQIYGGMGLMEDSPLKGCGGIPVGSESGRAPLKFSGISSAAFFASAWSMTPTRKKKLQRLLAPSTSLLSGGKEACMLPPMCSRWLQRSDLGRQSEAA